MSQVQVHTSVGGKHIYQFQIKCPYCHSHIIPNYLFWDNSRLFASCPNETCKKHFILSEGVPEKFVRVEPNAIPATRKFSEIISSISSDFVQIYNQAYHAEQMSLDQICGVGYRKALEFLIKDYLLSKETDNTKKENIKNKLLGNCIKEDVQDKNIKEVSKRAVWLGNDETHYIRKWADKDVSNLKSLIDLTIRWIENEVETDRVLKEMPDPK